MASSSCDSPAASPRALPGALLGAPLAGLAILAAAWTAEVPAPAPAGVPTASGPTAPAGGTPACPCVDAPTPGRLPYGFTAGPVYEATRRHYASLPLDVERYATRGEVGARRRVAPPAGPARVRTPRIPGAPDPAPRAPEPIGCDGLFLPVELLEPRDALLARAARVAEILRGALGRRGKLDPAHSDRLEEFAAAVGWACVPAQYCGTASGWRDGKDAPTARRKDREHALRPLSWDAAWESPLLGGGHVLPFSEGLWIEEVLYRGHGCVDPEDRFLPPDSPDAAKRHSELEALSLARWIWFLEALEPSEPMDAPTRERVRSVIRNCHEEALRRMQEVRLCPRHLHVAPGAHGYRHRFAPALTTLYYRFVSDLRSTVPPRIYGRLEEILELSQLPVPVRSTRTVPRGEPAPAAPRPGRGERGSILGAKRRQPGP